MVGRTKIVATIGPASHAAEVLGALIITVPYPTLIEDLDVGSRVQLGDGATAMRVTEIGTDCVVAQLENGGEANGRRGFTCRRRVSDDR